MINVTFGATGSDFNESSFGFQALVGANFKVEFAQGEDDGLDTARFYSNKRDFVELKGQFGEPVTEEPVGDEPVEDVPATLSDYVQSVVSYRVVDDGKVAFQVSGLAIDADELTSFESLARYLRKEAYDITGNKAANELYSAKGEDKLNGLDGNDFLFSGGGDDLLLGGKGNDTFDAGEGDDTISDKIGADTLIFHKGDGIDDVTGFNFVGKGHDTIDLSEYFSGDKELRFKDLDISKHGKSDVMIDFGDDNQIILHGVTTKQLDASDFQF